jgi:DNA repair protein RecO (recombination protein O)
MLHHLKAIVLHSVKYGESGMIAQVFTDLFGRQSFLVHGVRKKNSKISPYLFQPLSVLDIEAYIKENRNIQRIKELKASFPLQHIHFDIRKSSIALFLSEILNKTLHEADVNSSLFEYISNAIQVLDITESGIENFHLVFLMQYTKFLGIYPSDNPEIIRLNEDHSAGIPGLIQYSLTDISKMTIDRRLRQNLLNEIINYYTHHIEDFGKIKSFEILREVFD